MSKPDLSLPERIPELARYNTTPMSIDTFALYLLTNCKPQLPEILASSNAEMNEIVNTGNFGPQDDRVQSRCQKVFDSMKDVIEHHLGICDGEKLDPRYFLVVADAEWKEKGILAVNLDSGDPEDDGGDGEEQKKEFKPDMFWMKVEESGLLLVNLQIANTDWYEAKEDYEIGKDEES